MQEIKKPTSTLLKSTSRASGVGAYRNLDIQHYLYRITNTVNGREYIGIHSTSIINDGYLGSGIAIRSAIKKYGKESFKKEIIAFFDDRDSLLEQESVLVNREYVDRDDTYNLVTGGRGSAIKWNHSEQTRQKLSNRVVSAETREKLSALRTGWKPTPEILVNMSKAQQNRNPISEETRLRMSLSHCGKKRSEAFCLKMSDIAKLRDKATCPHCHKVGGNLGSMYRWHFDNCKTRTL